MDGNRLERVDDNGVYKCHMTLDSSGFWEIQGVKYDCSWKKLPQNPNSSLKTKMFLECILVGEENFQKTKKHPVKIEATSNESLCQAGHAENSRTPNKDKASYLVFIAVIGKEESDIEYFLKMTLAQEPSNCISIKRINYSILWEQLPRYPDEDKVRDVLGKASRTGEIFIERYKSAPSIITALLKRESRLVRSRAE